jgi:hypothetical protein
MFGLYRLILEIANIINFKRGLLRVAEIFMVEILSKRSKILPVVG